jgi:hypothetical protein
MRNSTARAVVGVVVTGLAAAAIATAGPLGGSTPRAGVTVKPNPVPAGAPSLLSATATNKSGKALPQIALGTLFPLDLAYSIRSTPPGGTCRATNVGGKRLVYCYVQNVGPRKKVALRLDVTPPVAGDYPITSYARNLDTMKETGASVTLTAS